VEEDPSLKVKLRLGPLLDGNPCVGITTNGMGVLMLSILMEGKVGMTGIPQMETLDKMGK